MPDEKPKYSKEFWKILFDNYFHDEIIDLADNFPKKSSLVVPFESIKYCWGHRGENSTSAVEYLLNNPDQAFRDADEALHGFNLPNDPGEGWEKARVEISGLEPVAIRDLRHEHLEKLVSIKGTILRKTDVKFSILNAAFKCARCDHVTNILQTDGALVKPFECENDVCGRKGPFKLLAGKSEWTDKRKIRLQETFDQIIEGEQSLSVLDAVMYGDVDCPPLGSTVTVSGILRGVQTVLSGVEQPDFYPVLEVNHIEMQEDNQAIEITQKDLEEMKKLREEPNIIERLVASTAPSIKGYQAIKEACICSAVSPDNFVLPDGRELRGYSHTMVCGDPSTGKSMIMQALQKLVPRAQYAAGKGATAKGLTVSVTKDKWSEGAWVAEAGMLVLADRALAIIDEMDKYEPEEQQELNSALAHGKIPIHKAGINREFYTRCPVIAGLNPKNGRFDEHETIPRQVNVPPDTLSRFDTVFIIQDKPKESDRGIAKHILKLWVKVSRKYAENYSNVKEIMKNWGKDEFAPDISMDLMRKWIARAKTIPVEVTPECAMVLEDFFMTIRMQGDDNRVPIVFRNLDGMVRLLIAEARLRHGKKTEMRDVQRVMALVTESLKAITDPETGKLDADIILSGMSKSQKERMEKIREAMISLKAEATIEAISRETGIPAERLEDEIDRLKRDGSVIELSRGVFRWVG